MSTLPPLNIRYPYDPTGRSPDNYVSGEVHTLPPSTKRIIVPRLGAYYADSLEVFHNGNKLTLNQDYELASLYQDATVASGQPVNVMIYFSNLEIDGDVTLNYQVVGGQFTGIWEAIQDYVNVLLVDPRKVKWDDIANKPDLYAPMYHFHDINDIYGLNHFVPKMEEIRQAVLRIRSREMRKVYDRIFKIKADLDETVAMMSNTIYDQVSKRIEDMDKSAELTAQINSIKTRVTALEANSSIATELAALKTKDSQLTTNINALTSRLNSVENTTLPTKLDKSEFNTYKTSITNTLNALDNKYIKLDKTSTLTVESISTGTNLVLGSYLAGGRDTFTKLRNLGLTSRVASNTLVPFNVFNFSNPTNESSTPASMLIATGYGNYYLRGRFPIETVPSGYTVTGGYVSERIATDKNIKEIIPISKEVGNTVKINTDGIYGSGLTYDVFDALPEEEWSSGTSILARNEDGSYYRMVVENKLWQDLGVAITVDEPIKSFIQGSNTEFNVKIVLTNSGNDTVEYGDLGIVYPSKQNASEYTIVDFERVLRDCKINVDPNEKYIRQDLVRLKSILPGGTCTVTFKLRTAVKGSFQIGAQVITNGGVDANTVNNHASITLYSSETAIVETTAEPVYNYTVNCPRIIPTIVETPEGAENYIGKSLSLYPTVTKNGERYAATIEDYTDPREYIEGFNQLPSGRWKFKIENASGYIVRTNYQLFNSQINDSSFAGIIKVDSDNESVFCVPYSISENIKLNGNLTSSEIRTTEFAIEWNPAGPYLTLTLTPSLPILLGFRPKGTNCEWQLIGFAAGEYAKTDDVQYRGLSTIEDHRSRSYIANTGYIQSNYTWVPDLTAVNILNESVSILGNRTFTISYLDERENYFWKNISTTNNDITYKGYRIRRSFTSRKVKLVSDREGGEFATFTKVNKVSYFQWEKKQNGQPPRRLYPYGGTVVDISYPSLVENVVSYYTDILFKYNIVNDLTMNITVNKQATENIALLVRGGINTMLPDRLGNMRLIPYYGKNSDISCYLSSYRYGGSFVLTVTPYTTSNDNYVYLSTEPNKIGNLRINFT